MAGLLALAVSAAVPVWWHPASVITIADLDNVWVRELDEWRAQGTELWAAIERPEGRVVDFLLDHGVLVYPVNPKALDRARDRFRQSGAKSDPFDARVLADFLRTDHGQRSSPFPVLNRRRTPLV